MFKKNLIAAMIGVTVAVAAVPAHAFTIQAGDFKMILDALDSATTAYGTTPGTVCATAAACDAAAAAPAPGSVGSVNTSADTMGIFSIASITNISTAASWFTRGVDGYLTGVFGNLTDYNVTVAGSTTSALASGGTFAMFLNTTQYDPTLGPLVAAGKDLNALLYPGVSGGSLVLSGAFGSGILFGDTTTTFSTTYNNLSIVGGSGGYLDVTGGAWQTNFDTNKEIGLNGEERDLLTSFTFRPNATTTAQGWTVLASGDITGNAIPEPGSMALAGLGLIGLAALRRRKPE
ncbi:MAG: PEP-CTERM sorting domain-containing protein [Gammaproteobacteria bacterium]|nr:PEP-CTERM sorting domain-containing protein [Rhodocyclaceae bacterium]MBU3910102.1 PEP-CTERM sorting domain-containing protein [Gammaproteobacteria bacterium]MBU4022564.1 PEP-CTERM sorting domain-containing protein [Gammaproteobacteria bacterium]MBU4097064.1 PEP-CTERM sorting domain-containing protein [Gammaproteobacteria bacterium]MBU4146856.1 PEP-CTERM sorting domain-containing protein [Gammaproteobacteria bacterium]